LEGNGSIVRQRIPDPPGVLIVSQLNVRNFLLVVKIGETVAPEVDFQLVDAQFVWSLQELLVSSRKAAHQLHI
jgi:hypothetical protein